MGTTRTRRAAQAAAIWRTVHGRVGNVRRLVPGLLEVTLAGFDDYPAAGGDEFVYTMVSDEPGGIRPDYGIDDVRRQDPDDPVRGAYYTVRRSRPARGEIDLWVVEHDHPGSVAEWMGRARPGDPVALWGPRRGFEPPADVRHLLLVADETGLAAVAALLERLPPDRRATAVLECLSPAHRPPIPDHPGLAITWVDRGGERPGVGERLADTTLVVLAGLRGATAPDAAFGVAESRSTGLVRRRVRRVAGIPAARMSMTGYWRRVDA